MPTKMLINGIDCLKEVLGGVQNEMYWRTYKPFVRKSEIAHIIPAIGIELHTYLVNLINANDEVGGNEKEQYLIEQLRFCLGEYVTMESQLAMLLLQGDGGTVVASPPNMQAPGKWMIAGRIAQARANADKSVESVLQYLESEKDAFPSWKNSTAYTLTASLFLSSATQFTDYYPAMQNSRRMYVTVRPYIEKVEREYIQNLLGTALYSELKAKLISNNPTWSIQEATILPIIRTIIANEAFRRALPFINVSADFRLVTENDGIETQNPLSEERLTGILVDAEKEVANESAKLKNYLNENASTTVFASYFNSDLYCPKTKNTPQLRETNNDKQIPFVL